jgi:hypothetical protein
MGAFVMSVVARFELMRLGVVFIARPDRIFVAGNG